MKRVILFGKVFLLNTILTFTLMSQDNTITPKINIITPTQYQFMKYGEYPITEHTGSPNISIPISNIELKNFNLPITLNYNARGIKVSEESDWVGLGWDLNLGSVVQVMNDRDDLDSRYLKKKIPYYSGFWPTTWSYRNTSAPEFTAMEINNNDNDFESDKTLSFLTFQDYFGGYGSSWDVKSVIDFRETIPNGGSDKLTDYESDIFLINTTNEKLYVLIKFGLTDTSFTVINKKGYDVRYHKSTGGWIMKTPSGIKYTFNEINNCKSSSLTGLHPWSHTFGDSNTLLEQTTTLALNATQGTGYTNSKIWQISKIENIYGECINFNYSTKKVLTSENLNTQWKLGTVSKQGYTLGYSYTTLERDRYCENVDGPYSKRPDNFQIGYKNNVLTTISTQDQERSYINSITYNGNKLVFYLSQRIDWINSSKLDSVVIFNSYDTRIKSAKFDYSYYESLFLGRGFKTKSSYVGLNDYRLKLNKLTLDNDQNFYFTYNNENLPSKNSFATDFWGYYNGQLQNKSFIANLEDFEPTNNLNNEHLNAFTANKPTKKYSNLQFAKAGILETIKFPTGGITKFYYSLNEFDNYFAPTNPIYQTGHYYGNGLKIDSTVIYNSENEKSKKISYNYENGKMQIPIKNYYVKSEAYTELEPNNSNGASIFTYSAQFLNLFSNNFYIANVTGNGNGIGYDKVISYDIDFNNNVSNGKVIRYYVNNPDIMHPLSYGDLIDVVPSYHKGFENGTILSEEIYKNTGIQKKTTYEYEISNPTNSIEYNSRTTYLGRWGVDCGYDQILVCYYPIYKPETLLSKKTTEDYLSGSTVNTTETFFYNQNNLLNYKSTEPSSIFRSLEDRFYYPTDIVNNAQYDLATKQNMQKLIDLNRLSEKVKIESSIRTKGQLTTKTTYVEYENGNRYLPLNFFSALGSNSLLCDLSVKYNSQSNIIEKKDKNLQVTSYVWSYNGQYPIAEIKNATYQQVSNAVPGFLSAIESWANPSDLMLNSFFGSLRSGLTGAQITTYTYKPLVGMTSATDPRGVTTYYDYDEFNRLKEVYQKDSNGSKLTITQHDYNYKH